MHTIEIPDNDKVITIPSHWDECMPEQLAYILQRAFEVVSGTIDVNAFRVLVFAKLTGFQPNTRYYFTKRMAPSKHAEVNAMIYQLAEQLCSWPFSEVPALEDDTPPAIELNIDTVKNLLPVIQCRRTKFVGPADLLADLTFAEFRAAIREMDMHIAHAKDPDSVSEAMDALNRFMAVLYRPCNVSGVRTPFDADELPKYALLASAIPLWQKQTTLLWFTYCIKYIQTEDINIDGQIINLSVLFPKSSGGTGTAKKGIGWAGLLYDIAKEGPFGNAEKTDKAGLFDILLYMYKNHLDNKELERKLKKKKK